MSLCKSIDEINQKIKSGSAVVLTADEFKNLSEKHSPAELVEKVDVVTTATFGPMCSSGAFINFGHPETPIRMEKISLNGVPVCAGVAAVDAYIGATEESANKKNYGGAHVIEDLIAGKSVELIASAKGTDCYPRKEVRTFITKDDVNEFTMFNPRNAYQNYPCAINSSDSLIYTYMGTLLPNLGNATYSTAGEISPLINDPNMRTIGVGTKIFLGGAQGFIAWRGTQFNTTKPRNESDIPKSNAATLAVIGDAKEMSSEYIKAACYTNYGVSIFVGIGIPIPVIDEDIAQRLSIRNNQITTTIFDYSQASKPALGEVTYDQLQSGNIELDGKKIRTAPMSSLNKARKIATELKQEIEAGEFTLTIPVQALPQNSSMNSLKIKGA